MADFDWTTLPEEVKRALLVQIRGMGEACMMLADHRALIRDWTAAEWSEAIAQTVVKDIAVLTPEQINILIDRFQKMHIDGLVLVSSKGPGKSL